MNKECCSFYEKLVCLIFENTCPDPLTKRGLVILLRWTLRSRILNLSTRGQTTVETPIDRYTWGELERFGVKEVESLLILTPPRGV